MGTGHCPITGRGRSPVQVVRRPLTADVRFFGFFGSVTLPTQVIGLNFSVGRKLTASRSPRLGTR